MTASPCSPSGESEVGFPRDSHVALEMGIETFSEREKIYSEIMGTSGANCGWSVVCGKERGLEKD